MFETFEAVVGTNEDLGTRWRVETRERALPMLSALRHIQDAAGPDIAEPQREAIDNAIRRLLDPEAIIGVAGVFSCGKSTLLNTVVGTALLPEAAKPSSAVPTHLKGGAHRRFAIVRGGLKNCVESEEEITEDELQLLRLGDEAAAARIKDARRIVCHGVLPHSLDGFTLVDTRGALDDDGGADRTAEAAQREDWDALVAVTLYTPGGHSFPDQERAFFQRIRSGQRPFLIVANLAFDESLDDAEQQALWDTLVKDLQRGPAWQGQALGDGNVYPIHLPTAKRARFDGDAAVVEASGYAAFERALVSAVANRRWTLKFSTCLEAILDRTGVMHDEVEAELEGLVTSRADQEVGARDKVKKARQIEEECEKARQELDRALQETKKACRVDFDRRMKGTDAEVATALQESEFKTLASIGNVAGLVTEERRNALAAEVSKIVQNAVEVSVHTWTDSGLAGIIDRELNPALLRAQIAARKADEHIDVEMSWNAGETQTSGTTKRASATAAASGVAQAMRSTVAGVSKTAGGAAIGYTVTAVLGKVLAVKLGTLVLSGAIKSVIAKIVLAKITIFIFTIIQPWVLAPLVAAVAIMGVAWFVNEVGTKVKKGVVKEYPEIRAELSQKLWKDIEPELCAELERTVSEEKNRVREREDKVRAHRYQMEAALNRSEPAEEHALYLKTLRSIAGQPEEQAAKSGLPNHVKALLIALDDAIDRRTFDLEVVRGECDRLAGMHPSPGQ